MLRLLALLPLTWLVLAGAGCSQNRPTLLPLRVLNSEAPRLELDEPARPVPPEAREAATPRIGAPGGSGAGARRVRPAQSGNDTVGGLPAGMGSTGPRG